MLLLTANPSQPSRGVESDVGDCVLVDKGTGGPTTRRPPEPPLLLLATHVQLECSVLSFTQNFPRGILPRYGRSMRMLHATAGKSAKLSTL